MPRLKLANSGLRSILSLLKAGCVSRALVFYTNGPSAMLVHQRFPGQFGVCQALADDLAHPVDESLKVVQVPIVKPESLLVKIAFQVVRFYRNVSTAQCALQAGPEVLHAVRVNLSLRVGYRVVDNLMLKLSSVGAYFRWDVKYIIPRISLNRLNNITLQPQDHSCIPLYLCRRQKTYSRQGSQAPVQKSPNEDCRVRRKTPRAERNPAIEMKTEDRPMRRKPSKPIHQALKMAFHSREVAWEGLSYPRLSAFIYGHCSVLRLTM